MSPYESCSVKGRGLRAFTKAPMVTASSPKAHGKLKHHSVLSVKTVLPQIVSFLLLFFFFLHQIPRKSVSLKENPISIYLGTESKQRERGFTELWPSWFPEKSTCSLADCREGSVPLLEAAAANEFQSLRGEGFISRCSNPICTSAKWRKWEGFQGLQGHWEGSETENGRQFILAPPLLLSDWQFCLRPGRTEATGNAKNDPSIAATLVVPLLFTFILHATNI